MWFSWSLIQFYIWVVSFWRYATNNRLWKIRIAKWLVLMHRNVTILTNTAGWIKLFQSFQKNSQIDWHPFITTESKLHSNSPHHHLIAAAISSKFWTGCLIVRIFRKRAHFKQWKELCHEKSDICSVLASICNTWF